MGIDDWFFESSDIQIVGEKMVDQGKRLIFMGGTCFVDFANGVNTYLVENDVNNYCWQVSATPNLTLTNPASSLAKDLPDNLNFVNNSAGFYSVRVTDATAEVAGMNGDGWPMFFAKSDYNGGDFIWMIDSVYSSYWADAGDYAFFN